MATPTVAGNALLIKQYFQDGWFPSGKRNSANSFVPSGALLKAMLIQSGTNMDTVTFIDSSGNPYQESTNGYPSNIQGYGKIQLHKVLNFGLSSNNPISLFVRGAADTTSPYYAQISTTSEIDTYTFHTSSSSIQPNIRITLTYTDDLATVGASITLINDLYLTITEGGTSKTYTAYLPNDVDINNVEMVDIPTPLASTTYTVTVRARVLSSVQSYALVITGDITEATWNSTSTSDSNSLSNSISTSMRNTIAILCLVIVVFGILLLIITYQLRRSQYRIEETYDADDDIANDLQSHHTRQSNHNSNGRHRNNLNDIEHRELTEHELEMISSRR